MTKLYVYDEDAAGLDDALWLLGVKHGIGAGSTTRFTIREFFNRNALLAAIAADPEPSLALVDLQADDYLDNNYSGHRIIEAIRRHPRLSRCRPLAFTIHDREDVVRLARDHGALGLVRRAGLEVDADRREAIALEDRLGEIMDVPLVAGRAPGTFALIPDSDDAGAARSDDDDDAAAAAILGVFTYRVDDDRPAFWDYIRFFADDIDPQSIKRWTMRDHGLSERVVKDDLNQLGLAARPRFRSRGLDMAGLARELLRAVPGRRLAPDGKLQLRTLHRFTEAAILIDDREVVDASYIDAEAHDALSRVLEKVAESEGPHPRSGHWWYAEALEGVLRAHFVGDLERLRPALVRGIHALFDTDAARLTR
jgi:hypothetical protein